jgi:hypothetical protein
LIPAEPGSVKNAFMPLPTGIHFTLGSKPSVVAPMLPERSYMNTRFAGVSAALVAELTHASVVEAGPPWRVPSRLSGPGVAVVAPEGLVSK